MYLTYQLHNIHPICEADMMKKLFLRHLTALQSGRRTFIRIHQTWKVRLREYGCYPSEL